MAKFMIIQSGLKMLLQRRKYLDKVRQFKVIQRYFRSKYERSRYLKVIAAAKVINRNVRMLLGKVRGRKRRYVLTRIQAFYRMRL